MSCTRIIAQCVILYSGRGLARNRTSGRQTLPHQLGRAVELASNIPCTRLDIPCYVHRHQTGLSTVSSLPDKENDSFSPRKQYTICRIRGDGNCLFRALVQSYHSVMSSVSISERLSAEEENVKSKELRQEICDMMIQQRDFIEPFLPECDFESYVRAMRQDSAWGGEPELSIASLVLQFPIVVYGPQGGYGLVKIAEYDLSGRGTSSTAAAEIAVLYSGGTHYDSLIDMAKY